MKVHKKLSRLCASFRSTCRCNRHHRTSMEKAMQLHCCMASKSILYLVQTYETGQEVQE